VFCIASTFLLSFGILPKFELFYGSYMIYQFIILSTFFAMYLTIHNKIEFTIMKKCIPIHDLNLVLIK